MADAGSRVGGDATALSSFMLCGSVVPGWRQPWLRRTRVGTAVGACHCSLRTAASVENDMCNRCEFRSALPATPFRVWQGKRAVMYFIP